MSTPDEVDAVAEEEQMAQLSFGNALRLRREAQGILQRDLARTINVDPSTLSKWEGQQKAPRDRKALIKLAAALGCTVEELAAGLIAGNNQRILTTAGLHPAIDRVLKSVGPRLQDKHWLMVAAYIQALGDVEKAEEAGTAELNHADQ
jgi:transcriptional regulator with XRE-family HTH domain